MSYMQPAMITEEVARSQIQTSSQTIQNAIDNLAGESAAFDTIVFRKEAEYAKHIIARSMSKDPRKNQNKLFMCTQNSIYDSIRQIVDTGLTLNPKADHAYLIPRKNYMTGELECTFEPSYKGLIHAAIQGKCIKHATATVIYKQQINSGEFVYNGPNAEPTFNNLNPFHDYPDADIAGAICTAFLENGGVITTNMKRSEIEKARKAAGNTPAWRDWFSEMCCKCVVRRASKYWPSPDTDSRFFRALDLLKTYDQGIYSKQAESEAPILNQERLNAPEGGKKTLHAPAQKAQGIHQLTAMLQGG